MGVRLDLGANGSGARQISHPDSAVKALVIPTNEQWLIARGAPGLAGQWAPETKARDDVITPPSLAPNPSH
ncbi:hypothetical protein [Phenylobacterium immobile]|uniref:hypothetical protein n=1 Tax=Phenylobacterium immobile TaxID=21 RepID=UPI003CCBD846